MWNALYAVSVNAGLPRWSDWERRDAPCVEFSFIFFFCIYFFLARRRTYRGLVHLAPCRVPFGCAPGNPLHCRYWNAPADNSVLREHVLVAEIEIHVLLLKSLCVDRGTGFWVAVLGRSDVRTPPLRWVGALEAPFPCRYHLGLRDRAVPILAVGSPRHDSIVAL